MLSEDSRRLFKDVKGKSPPAEEKEQGNFAFLCLGAEKGFYFQTKEVRRLPTEAVLKKKKEFVKELTAKMKESSAGVLVDYRGINVEQDTKMRRELREANVEYFVVKNTMLRFACKELGFEGLEEHLEGTTALAISKEDTVAPAKILSKYQKDLEEETDFKIKAGFVDGKVVDKATIMELGSLPSKEQLVGQLLSVLVAPIRGLAVSLHAVAEQKEGGETSEQ